jgi:hypothetical protein
VSRSCRPSPRDAKLYARVQRAAKQQFVWPSIYANAWVSREYKRRGGKYSPTCAAERQQRQGLAKWFDEQWVDLSRPLGPKKWAACGRPRAGRRAYPKCVPLARARAMTPAQIRSAIRRKRTVERRPRRGGRARFVATRV